MRKCNAATWIGLLTAAAAVSACSSGGEPIDGPITTLVVMGTVSDGAGAAVPGAIVTVSWRPGPCDQLTSAPPDTTSAAGRFSVTVFGWGTFTHACVRVDAEPPAGGTLAAASSQIASVPLDPKSGPDSLTVDVTLSPAP